MNEVEFLTFILKGLASYPEDVAIEKAVDDKGIILTVSLANEDKGKIIGKAGSNAKSIRTIMHTFGFNIDQRIYIKINN